MVSEQCGTAELKGEIGMRPIWPFTAGVLLGAAAMYWWKQSATAASVLALPVASVPTPTPEEAVATCTAGAVIEGETVTEPEASVSEDAANDSEAKA